MVKFFYGEKMIQIVWLNSTIIKIQKAKIIIDCYGTSNERTFIIQSKSYCRITDVVDAWSVK